MRSLDGPAGRRGGTKGAAAAQRMPRDLTSVKAWRAGQVMRIYRRELCIENSKCKGPCIGWRTWSCGRGNGRTTRDKVSGNGDSVLVTLQGLKQGAPCDRFSLTVGQGLDTFVL